LAIFSFDTTEFVSLIAASIGLLITVYFYFFKKVKDYKEGMLDVRLIFFIFIFLFLNRFFTNIEALGYKPFFNLLEHISSALAAISAAILSWKGFKRWSK
jgi:hypothetical protein